MNNLVADWPWEHRVAAGGLGRNQFILSLSWRSLLWRWQSAWKGNSWWPPSCPRLRVKTRTTLWAVSKLWWDIVSWPGGSQEDGGEGEDTAHWEAGAGAGLAKGPDGQHELRGWWRIKWTGGRVWLKCLRKWPGNLGSGVEVEVKWTVGEMLVWNTTWPLRLPNISDEGWTTCYHPGWLPGGLFYFWFLVLCLLRVLQGSLKDIYDSLEECFTFSLKKSVSCVEIKMDSEFQPPSLPGSAPSPPLSFKEAKRTFQTPWRSISLFFHQK